MTTCVEEFNFERYDGICNLLLTNNIKTFSELLPHLKKFTYVRRDEVEMAFSWIKQLSIKDPVTGLFRQAFPEVKYVHFV